MKAIRKIDELEIRAREALEAVLHQVSTVELKGIEKKAPVGMGPMEFVVQVGVLGRDHTLTCRVAANCEEQAVREAIREMQNSAAQNSCDTIPVFVAPHLSPEAQALCMESNTGFVDLEDNARLVLGEVFIGKRSVPRRERRPAVNPQAGDAAAAPKMIPSRATAPVAARSVQVISAA
jgi:hypothetical protein